MVNCYTFLLQLLFNHSLIRIKSYSVYNGELVLGIDAFQQLQMELVRVNGKYVLKLPPLHSKIRNRRSLTIPLDNGESIETLTSNAKQIRLKGGEHSFVLTFVEA